MCAGFLRPRAAGARLSALRPAAKLARSLQQGPRRAVALLARFRGEGPARDRVPAWGADLFDPDHPGGVSHFYRAMSLGRLEVSGTVAPRWYVAAGRTAEYLARDPWHPGRYGAFALEILRQADRDLDFSQCDSDGDGAVDAVFLVVASTPESFLLGSATGISDLGLERGAGAAAAAERAFVTADRGASGRPVRILSEQGTIQVGRTFADATGAVCHGFGHLLGLPDLMTWPSCRARARTRPTTQRARACGT